MTVLIEGISVIIKREVIEQRFPGGWQAFVNDVPNQTLCADDELARVGFMTPDDVGDYISHLENFGLIFQQDEQAVDIVVADQQQGLTISCDWAEFGHLNLDNDPDQRIAACRMVGSTLMKIITPDGWTFEGSLSDQFGFAPTDEKEKSLKFIRHENGLDVYWNVLTGEEVFIGRTSESEQKGIFSRFKKKRTLSELSPASRVIDSNGEPQTKMYPQQAFEFDDQEQRDLVLAVAIVVEYLEKEGVDIEGLNFDPDRFNIPSVFGSLNSQPIHVFVRASRNPKNPPGLDMPIVDMGRSMAIKEAAHLYFAPVSLIPAGDDSFFVNYRGCIRLV